MKFGRYKGVTACLSFAMGQTNKRRCVRVEHSFLRRVVKRMRKSLSAMFFVLIGAEFGFSNGNANLFTKTVKGNDVVEMRKFDPRGFDCIHLELPIR